ncbi:type II CAAX prenyl endopeptidase Rce1 family protein [Streptomyces kebangsaanensis]|uniref:Type II CAAX prenyl endopeptidase Rce1 family protein n=1 Tax=Streptomyces kebangsaanensis TaxID=864058 RepID=A0ABW6KY47_9ACTN
MLFGLWHVLPSLRPAAAEPAPTRVFGHSVLGAAVADVRRRGGSLPAPMGLHRAVNGLGCLAGFLLR